MHAAKQDDCSCVLRPCEQQTLAIFFCHLGFTTARYQWGHIARVSQIARHSGYVTPYWLKLNESMVAKMVSRVSYLIYYNLYIE